MRLSAPSDAAIETRGISKQYGSIVAVDDVSFRLDRGEVVGFVGPNGAGKSTFMKMLVGIVHPTTGTGFVNGHDVRKESTQVRRGVGYLPGDVGLYRNLRGDEFLDFAISFHPNHDSDLSRRLARQLKVPLDRKIKTYSSGMKQKLALIQALAVGAETLLLDEPTRGLDPTMQSEFLQLLRDERDRGRSILLSSHILGEVEHACDRIVFIDRGKLIPQERIEAARGMFRRRLRVTFEKKLEKEGEHERALQLVKGVEVLDQRAGETFLRLTGELGPTLAELASLGLESIDYNRPSLEEIYRALYLQEQDGEAQP